MTEFTLEFLIYKILHHLKLTCQLFEISVCKSALMTDPKYHVAILFYITYPDFGSADSQLKDIPKTTIKSIR